MKRGVVARLGAALAWVENALIATLAAGLVLLAGGQILARMLFQAGWVDLDTFLRTLVLWLALLGAMAAARDDKHLAVDAVSRYVKGVAAKALRAIALLATAAISAAIAWYALDLVRTEYEFQTPAFAGIPAWAIQAIMPFAFAVMALRFALRAFTPPPPREE